jgi:hypothetical protein
MNTHPVCRTPKKIMNLGAQSKLIVIRKTPRDTPVVSEKGTPYMSSTFSQNPEVSFMDQNTVHHENQSVVPDGSSSTSRFPATAHLTPSAPKTDTSSDHPSFASTQLVSECRILREENSRLRAELEESRAVNKELLRACQVMRSGQLIR